MIKGDRLRKLRQDKRVSADEAATALRMGKSQLLNYENEKSDPSTDALLRLMDYYNVSADYLLGKTDFARPPILSVNLPVHLVLQQMGLERGASFLKRLGVPIKVQPIDILEMLQIFPPETVAAFLKALDVRFNVTGLTDNEDTPLPDESDDK